MEINQFVKLAIQEDVKQGDHSTLSCIPKNSVGSAKLLVKENGIISGINLAKEIFNCYDPTINFKSILKDGQKVTIGDVAFIVSGKSGSILTIERLVLNVMQRMRFVLCITDKAMFEREYATRTSALVGVGLSIMDSNIWVATTTGFPCIRHVSMICFCNRGTSSGAHSTPRSPRATTVWY